MSKTNLIAYFLFSARLLESFIAEDDSLPELLPRLVCSVGGTDFAPFFFSLLLSPPLLAVMNPALARLLERLLPSLQLPDLYRLLAGLHPARPDLAPLYASVYKSEDHGVECKADRERSRASAAGLLHLFLVSLLEAVRRETAAASLEAAFQLALLPVGDSLRNSALPIGCDREEEERIAPLRGTIGASDSVKEAVLACGYAHVLVKRTRGPPLAWGANNAGCTGLPPTNAACHAPGPLRALSGVRVVQVACGRSHSLALTDSGVYSWGSNRYGQLGTGPLLARTSTPTWIAVGGGGVGGSTTAASDVIITKISAGQYHSLAVDAGGRLYSWGWGVHGQLGHRHTNVEDVDRPTVVALLRRHRIVDAAGGFAHSLALSDRGEVFAFGLGLFGQLGGGTTAKAMRPCRVALPGPARLIATGYFHNLAVVVAPGDGGGQLLFQWGAHPQVGSLVTKLVF
jgi:alpha-tubulin suppressor-like RCC1 family protein